MLMSQTFPTDPRHPSPPITIEPAPSRAWQPPPKSSSPPEKPAANTTARSSSKPSASFNPTPTFFGLGGRRMEALGFRPIVRPRMSPSWASPRSSATCRASTANTGASEPRLRTEKPDIAILIDFPDVNLSLARHLKRQGVPVIYFRQPSALGLEEIPHP